MWRICHIQCRFQTDVVTEIDCLFQGVYNIQYIKQTQGNMTKSQNLAVRILLLCIHTTTVADQWVKYAQDPEMTQYEYNHTRISHHNDSGKTFVVWSRTPETTTRYELHCGSQSYRKTYEITRNLQEVVWQRDDSKAKWWYAVPEGTEMALIDKICKNYD